MRAQLAGVLGLAHDTGLVVVGVEELQEGVERHLGVDDDLAAAGHVHDHVGAQPAFVGRRRDLLVEVAVREHAGHLGHPAQLDLAPSPAGLRRPQRRHQVPGLLAQLLVPEMQLGHLLGQPLVGALALELHLLEPALVAGQRLAQRIEQAGDGLLALVQVALRRRARLFEPGVGQGQELLVVLGQGVGRQLGERPRQPGALVLGPRLRLVRRPLQESQLRERDGPRRLGRRGRVRHSPELHRLFGQGRLRVGQPPLGEPDGGGDTGAAHEVPGATDGQPDGQPEHHSEDHEANVTTGCVNFGDRLRAGSLDSGTERARNLGVVTPQRSR